MNQDSINGVGWFPIEQPNFLQIDGTRTNPQIIPNFKPFTLFQQYVHHPTKRRTCPLLPKLPKFAQKTAYHQCIDRQPPLFYFLTQM